MRKSFFKLNSQYIFDANLQNEKILLIFFNAQALAWGGLQMTTAWKNNPETNLIKAVNSAGRTPTPKDYTKYKFENFANSGVQ